jgi:hypothetical protein
MTGAALVISIIAAILAAASTWYTRRQATEASLVREIEDARRHEELAPVLVGEFLPISNTRHRKRPGVKITNNGPIDLDRIDAVVIPAHMQIEEAIEGFFDPGSTIPASSQESTRIPRGGSWTFEIIPTTTTDGTNHYRRGGQAKFRCRCHAIGHEPWDVVVTVDIPGQARVYGV